MLFHIYGCIQPSVSYVIWKLTLELALEVEHYLGRPDNKLTFCGTKEESEELHLSRGSPVASRVMCSTSSINKVMK